MRVIRTTAMRARPESGGRVGRFSLGEIEPGDVLTNARGERVLSVTGVNIQVRERAGKPDAITITIRGERVVPEGHTG